jgi:hypothetical protein
MQYGLFKEFDKPTQIDLTIENGVLIDHRQEQDELLLLFQLESFYVELTYLEAREEILAIYSSEDDGILEPYLERMDVSELIG